MSSNKWTPEHIQILRAMTQTMCDADIAEKLLINTTSVQRIRRTLGIPLTVRQKRKARKPEPPTLNLRVVRMLELAEKCGRRRAA